MPDVLDGVIASPSVARAEATEVLAQRCNRYRRSRHLRSIALRWIANQTARRNRFAAKARLLSAVDWQVGSGNSRLARAAILGAPPHGKASADQVVTCSLAMPRS